MGSQRADTQKELPVFLGSGIALQPGSRAVLAGEGKCFLCLAVPPLCLAREQGSSCDQLPLCSGGVQVWYYSQLSAEARKEFPKLRSELL